MLSYEKPDGLQTASNGEILSEVQKTAPKKRASIACIACRKRKVRCDFLASVHLNINGQPTCSNCKAKNMACTVEESRRRK